jgi:hypothetical protein
MKSSGRCRSFDSCGSSQAMALHKHLHIIAKSDTRIHGNQGISCTKIIFSSSLDRETVSSSKVMMPKTSTSTIEESKAIIIIHTLLPAQVPEC